MIYGYHFRPKMLYARTNVDYSQYEHYFGTLDIKVSFNYQLKELATNARKNAVTEWSVWIIYSANRVSAGRAAELRTVMEELNYSQGKLQHRNHPIQMELARLWSACGYSE